MKVSVLIVVGLMLSSSCITVSLARSEQLQIQSVSLEFEEPSLLDDGSYLHVTMPGATGCVYQPGKPVLPMYTTTLQLPFGSTIHDLTIQYDEMKTIHLQKKITLAPYPYIEGTSRTQSEAIPENEGDDTGDFYPQEVLSYSTGAGLNQDNEHVTFVTIRVHPTQYNAPADSLRYFHRCQLFINYKRPLITPFSAITENDLVIITPMVFASALERLADHKNTLGIRTKVVTLGDIYYNYKGYDQPEQIKYFIKNAVEEWGTTYVLLIGGLKSHLVGKPRDNINTGTRDWYLPVRYTNLVDSETQYDPGFISDLYYADLYDGTGSFCNWDSNGDGTYGAWKNNEMQSPLANQIDQIDFYPDVCIGRLPCRNIAEVNSMINKIIAYEATPADPAWFKKMVVVGGDPYDDQGTQYIEGELIGQKAVSYMPEFEPRKLFASNRGIAPELTPETQNIVREINEGCGFLFFDGHGGPSWWNTYWPGDFNAMIKNGGLTIYDFYQLKNYGKLPVCIIGGCHDNLFNISMLMSLFDFKNRHFMWSSGVPTPECFGWSLTVKPKGGAIATIGNTALGLEAGGEVGDLNGDGINEPDCVEALCGYLESQFFKGYGTIHLDMLGENWCYAIGQYLNIYPGMNNISDAKVIEQWVLFGDPSLKIGGYPQ
jgi:hypothetical protein